MVAGFFLALLALFSPVGGVAVLLFTDKSCQNQVGRLEGNYGGVCQSTLGTAAISFKVVNIDSGCLGMSISTGVASNYRKSFSNMLPHK